MQSRDHSCTHPKPIEGVQRLNVPSCENKSRKGETHCPSCPCPDMMSLCRDVVGEIVKIEEHYWVKLPNGNETHMHGPTDRRCGSHLLFAHGVMMALVA